MRQWSEREIFDFLTDHLRRATDACEALAVNRRKGPIYNQLRHDLVKLEGMFRVVGYLRQDARWLQVGLVMNRVHQAAGDWLRGVPQKPGPDGRPRPALAIPASIKHPLFMKLAEFLREQERSIVAMKNARTGRTGVILPRMLEPPEIRRPTNYPVARARAASSFRAG
jgi:hypothetical protein